MRPSKCYLSYQGHNVHAAGDEFPYPSLDCALGLVDLLLRWHTMDYIRKRIPTLIRQEKSENSDDMRMLLRPRSRMLLKGDEGGVGGHYPLGHLRRGGWIYLSVTGNGGP